MFKTTIELLSIFDKGTRWRLACFIFLTAVTGILEFVSLGAFIPLIQFLSNPDQLPNIPFIGGFLQGFTKNDKNEVIIIYTIVIVLIFILKNSAILIVTYLQALFVNRIFVKYTKKLFDQYLAQPYIFHLNENSARMTHNLTQGINAIINSGIQPLMMIAIEGFLIIAALSFLLFAEPKATLIIVSIIFPSAGLVYWTLQSRYKKWGSISHTMFERFYKVLNESMGGIKEIKVHRAEGYASRSLSEVVEPLLGARTKIQASMQVPKTAIETAIVLALLVIIVIAVTQGSEIDKLVNTLAVFVLAATRLLPSTNRLLNQFNNVLVGQATIDIVRHDLNLVTAQSMTSEDASAKIKFTDKLELIDVSFAYNNDRQFAVQNIDVIVNKGESVAFVGPSGAGKSTLIDIILGLLPPQSGSVTVDGKRLSDVLMPWQRDLGYVPQMIYLTDDTIRRNVAFGLADQHIDDTHVWRALRNAQLDDVVAGVPDGLDALIGEHGSRLSGGQRQRIGIARALYHNPDILIFDEATSSLDGETERSISETVRQLGGKKTILIIAHRLSTVRHCDKLVFMIDGRCVDSGTYDDLIARNSQFRLFADHMTERDSKLQDQK